MNITDKTATISLPTNPILPEHALEQYNWSNLNGCADALALAAAIEKSNRFILIICSDNAAAIRLEQEINCFLDKPDRILAFPDWETLSYDVFSPLPEITSQRLHTLYALSQQHCGALIVPAPTLMHKLAPRAHILANTFIFEVGAHFDLDGIRLKLESVGYQCVSTVMQHGEFALRGSILDLFPMGSLEPYRIELFDDEIESIRSFDPETQRSKDKKHTVRLFPAREFPFDDAAIKRFRQAFRSNFPETPSNCPIYQDISKGIAFGGIEYYQPLFVERMESLLDYVPDNTLCFLHQDIASAARQFSDENQARFLQRQQYIDRPPLEPAHLFLTTQALYSALSRMPRIQIGAHTEWLDSAHATYPVIHFNTRTLDQPSDAVEAATALKALLENQAHRILFIAESAGHRESYSQRLGKLGLHPITVNHWHDFIASDLPYALWTAQFEQGVILDDFNLALIPESFFTGNKAQQGRRRKKSHKDFGQLLKNLEELQSGMPVVHRDHGVGRFLGLQILNVGGVDAEFLALEYAGMDKLYVPVSSLHLVSRYGGASPEQAPLHRLGGEQWEKARKKALDRVRDVAAELLDIYARRAARQGHSFNAFSDEYYAFSNQFPFEETPDQETAIQDVASDLANVKPMDRVICGDVGFGKTEVAMRAAFIAAQNEYQVAVLVPTTLLAQQHFKNFLDRFADWPFRIEVLSRFISPKQQKAIIGDIESGKVDIIIGTHKLLQQDIKFNKLGLVIIDEEHRFGVSQKEHFKKLRTELDFLTLTATPIPRTLDMAMSGLRDISIIATPPPNRHVIRTFITEWDDLLLQEAILREIRRGGQVYFVHNKIETLEKMKERLYQLVPEIRLQIAHGQMPERDLEQIMLDFYHQRFNILLCTTIVESGIDVPSANTIIIDRADTFGLAQLHQLRGRVGRSHHRAYAYMITPPKKMMSSDAIKRLDAIEAAGELGAGFLLSANDLEIRGAGELLGDDQSGQIQEIGLGMYTDMLEHAVKAIKSGKLPELDMDLYIGPEIDLQCPALIPDDYLPDITARLVLYKRIANAVDDDELWRLQVEMIDRFGLLPDPAKYLFNLTHLKLQAERLGIRKIEGGSYGLRLIFSTKPQIDPVRILMLIQQKPSIYKLDGPDKLKILRSFKTHEEKFQALEQILKELAVDSDGKVSTE